jgi:hypothetical protein
MSPGGPIPVTGAAVRVGDVGGAVVEALRRHDLSVRALVRRDDERVDASRATGAEVVVAPRPALTGTRLDPLRGRQRIEASPGKEQVSGLRASVGSTEASASLPARVGVVGPKRAWHWVTVALVRSCPTSGSRRTRSTC